MLTSWGVGGGAVERRKIPLHYSFYLRIVLLLVTELKKFK